MARTKCFPPFNVSPKPPQDNQPTRVSQRARKRWSTPSKAQDGSAFISRSPREIRCMIYAYVFAPDQEQYKKAQCVNHNDDGDDGANGGDAADSPSKCTFVFRPMLRKRQNEHCSSIALLQLCQLIYNEALPLSVSASVHHITYLHPQIPNCKIPVAARDYLELMRHEQISQIKDIHLFVDAGLLTTCSSSNRERLGVYRSENPLAEMAAIRCGFREIFRQPLCPDALTITIRAEDWGPRIPQRDNKQYSLNHLLRNRYWGNVFRGLRTLCIELEVELTARSLLLQNTLEDLKCFVFDLGDGSRLVPEVDVCELEWRCPAGIAKNEWRYEDSASSCEETRRRVFKVLWRLQRTSEPAIL